jgi:PTH1 family peptidyl-tRNA hydrolase
VEWVDPSAKVCLVERTVPAHWGGKLLSDLEVDDLSRLVVAHDELDLEQGRVKVKVGGGLAGHNGLKSIVQHGGGSDFVRVRVGVGRPPQKGADHVLSDFSKLECSELPGVLERASLAVTDILDRGVSAAMNSHNQTPAPADRGQRPKGNT